MKYQEIHKITFSNENRKMQYPYSTYHERKKFSILKQTGETLPNDMLVMGVWVQIKDANSSHRCKPIRKTWQQCTTKSSSPWHYLARYNLSSRCFKSLFRLIVHELPALPYQLQSVHHGTQDYKRHPSNCIAKMVLLQLH